MHEAVNAWSIRQIDDRTIDGEGFNVISEALRVPHKQHLKFDHHDVGL